MSTLTESIFTENSKKPSNENKNPWYDIVYLCIEKKGNNQYINGFTCYTFNNFTNADIFYKNKFNDEKRRHIMIPVCKWIPFVFHKYYIDYALKKNYWKNDITIFRNQKYI
jgi:hypothetical protein